MTRRSTLVSRALDGRNAVRAEFEDMRLAAYERAAEACRGTMLNARGKAAGIDSLSLFMGSAARAYAYASEELVEHWQTYPRPVFEEYEREQAEVGFSAEDNEIDRLTDIIRRARAQFTEPVPWGIDTVKAAVMILEEL